MHNNQYISSLPRPKNLASHPNNLIDAISENRLVSINYDSKASLNSESIEVTKSIKSI
jgi:hypothetical protein